MIDLFIDLDVYDPRDINVTLTLSLEAWRHGLDQGSRTGGVVIQMIQNRIHMDQRIQPGERDLANMCKGLEGEKVGVLYEGRLVCWYIVGWWNGVNVGRSRDCVVLTVMCGADC